MSAGEILRPAAEVAELGRRDVDSQVAVESCQDLLDMYGSISNRFAQARCRADHLAAVDSAAGQ